MSEFRFNGQAMAPRTTRSSASHLAETANSVSPGVRSRGSKSNEKPSSNSPELVAQESPVRKPSPSSRRNLRNEMDSPDLRRTTDTEHFGHSPARATEAKRSGGMPDNVAPKAQNAADHSWRTRPHDTKQKSSLCHQRADAGTDHDNPKSDASVSSGTESCDTPPPRKRNRAEKRANPHLLRDTVGGPEDDLNEDLPRSSKALRKTQEADMDLYTPSAAERMLLRKDDERILRELAENSSDDEKPTMMFGYFL